MNGPKTPLAVVWTRPETVRDDAARALAMIGFRPAPEDGTAVVSSPETAGRGPGRSTAPWHLAAALSVVRDSGADAPGARISARTRVALHLPVATLDPETGVACCLRALALCGGGDPLADDAQARHPWIDAAQAAMDKTESVFLVDATLAPGHPSADAPLRPRNLLLAGYDPLALDMVAARLMGLDPLSIPLLFQALASDPGGWGLEHVDLLGDRDDYLTRPGATWRPASRGRLGRTLQRGLDRLFVRGRPARTTDTPWHVLWRREQTATKTPTEGRDHA